MITPADLIQKYISVRDHIAAENKRYSEYIAPYNKEMDDIGNQLLAMLNEQKCENFKTEFGTAYKSTLMNAKVADRDKFIDFAFDNWDAIGNELLIVSAQKDAIRQHMEGNNGQPPPGVEVGFFTRVNIRK